ncbi:MAG: hypothetical protein K8T89_11210 [Planctomycetes bacterium]|nr:hypothetical protein [Planctomycetota bacterium]
MLAFSLIVCAFGQAEPPMWLTDYPKAASLAKEQRKDLLIHFRKDATLEKALEAPELREKLSRFVCVNLPMDATINGEKLIQKDPFAPMRKNPGLCIISLHDGKLPTHDKVISVHPLINDDKRWELGIKEIGIILDLPAKATLTQRSLIYALTVHPDAPKSIQAIAHPAFLAHANTHSVVQAEKMELHHADLPAVIKRLAEEAEGVKGGSEVVAMTSGGELLDGCHTCVKAWKNSEPHWTAIMAEHKYYGYDIVKAANGAWYATGIFGD